MTTDYEKVLGEGESLKVFLRAMAKLQRTFCESMTRGVDFTIKFEVHGNNGNLIHCRVLDDSFDRPAK